MKSITLIGMPGSGKSTVGMLLAGRLGWEFVDTDRIIEDKRAKLQAVLDERGADEFRQIETEAVLSLKAQEGVVVSTGGSVVYSPEAMAHLKQMSAVVFLNAPLALIQERIDGRARGILGLKEKGWEALYAERLPLYKKYADVEIPIAQETPDMIAEHIIKKLAD